MRGNGGYRLKGARKGALTLYLWPQGYKSFKQRNKELLVEGNSRDKELICPRNIMLTMVMTAHMGTILVNRKKNFQAN